MRTRLKSLLIAILLLSLVEAPVFAAPSRALGVITQADRARLSSGDATSGATVFDGDTLATQSTGGLLVRLGEAQLYLLGNSAVTVRQLPSGVSSTLERGTAIFSSPSAEAFELRASEARIRAKTPGKLTYAQVTLAGPYELVLTCQRGELAVTIGEEVHAVLEATSYRVTIDAPTQAVQGSGAPPVATGRSRWKLIALILIGAGTSFGVVYALLSPHRIF